MIQLSQLKPSDSERLKDLSRTREAIELVRESLIG